MASQGKDNICGVVMPISAIDGCSESHWKEVYAIIKDAIKDADFEGNLVSEADDSGIIHKRIINNLYDNPIVVCDVSGKNPNVMFELGMRLAFDKPTIIIKDNMTSYTFDTSVIEHLEYPRDLRFKSIIEFKKNLSSKIRATFENSINDKNYTTFLKHFGQFKVANIEQKEISSDLFILKELKELKDSIASIHLNSNNTDARASLFNRSQTLPLFDSLIFEFTLNSDVDIEKLSNLLEDLHFIQSYELNKHSNKSTLTVNCKPEYSRDYTQKRISSLLSNYFDIETLSLKKARD